VALILDATLGVWQRGYMNNLSESYNFWQQIQWLIKANVGFMCQAFVKPASGLTVTAGSQKVATNFSPHAAFSQESPTI